MAPALTSFEQFVTFLTENKVPHRADAASQVVEMPSNAAPLPGNLFVKWERTVPFLQLIQFMVNGVPAERVRELEAAMARLNNQLEVGGFGLDHQNRRLYCRLTVPVLPPDGIDAMHIDKLARGVVRNGQEFLEAFTKVIAGEPGETIVSIYETIAKERQAAAAAPQS